MNQNPFAESGGSPPDLKKFLDLIFPCPLKTGLTIEIRGVKAGAVPESKRMFYASVEAVVADYAMLRDWNEKEQRAIYVVTAVRNGRDGTKAGCAQIHALWADCDGDSSDKTPIGRALNKQAILAHVKDTVPADLFPTVVVDSGTGLQLWWLFPLTEQFSFMSKATRKQDIDYIERILQGLQPVLRSDGTRTDVSSMMRLPGFKNMKHADAPQARIVEEETDLSRRFSVEQFEKYAVAEAEPTVTTSAQDDEIVRWFNDAKMILEDDGDKIHVLCPWEHEHEPTGAPRITDTSLLLDGDKISFKCQHDHCKHRHIGTVVQWFKDRFKYQAREPKEPQAPQPMNGNGSEYTDVAHARKLVASKHCLRYCEAESRWYLFDGRQWKPGSPNLVAPHVHQMARELYACAAAVPDRDKRARYAKEAMQLETDHRIRGIINQARALPELQIEPDQFDRDPYLLNVANGVLDLRTGLLLPHDPKYLMSKITMVDYDPEAKSELWEQTLDLAMEHDQEMVAFLQRWFGYCLTGDVSEDKLMVQFGETRTAKTTIVGTLQKVAGDYAATLRVEALLLTKHADDKIPHEIASLHGKRMVVTSETPQGKPYNEPLLKNLTGGDKQRACFKYENTFEFDPTMKLNIYTNYRPEFEAGEDAVWARVLTVDFLHDFTKDTEHPLDPNVKKRLKEPEHQRAVLAWAVRGCLAWQRGGLQPPLKVLASTARHRSDVDVIRRFLEAQCEATETPSRWARHQALHRAYRAWAKGEDNASKLTSEAFKAGMIRLGYQPERPRNAQGNYYTVYPGVALVGGV